MLTYRGTVYPWHCDQIITYAREVKAGAVVSISSVLTEVRERKLRFTHEMRNDETGALVASASIVGVHMDTLTRRAIAFEDRVAEAARALLPLDRPPTAEAEAPAS